MSDNTAVAQSLFKAWEKRDFKALGKRLADGVTLHDVPRGQLIKGKADVTEYYASWTAACPDAVVDATIVAASDDTVAVEGVWAGTNTGPFGSLPPTGRSISMPWANLLRFDPSGLVMQGTAYYDQLTALTQLGHMDPAPLPVKRDP